MITLSEESEDGDVAFGFTGDNDLAVWLCNNGVALIVASEVEGCIASCSEGIIECSVLIELDNQEIIGDTVGSLPRDQDLAISCQCCLVSCGSRVLQDRDERSCRCKGLIDDTGGEVATDEEMSVALSDCQELAIRESEECIRHLFTGGCFGQVFAGIEFSCAFT